MCDKMLQRVKYLEEAVERLKNQLRMNNECREEDDVNKKTTPETLDGQTESKPGLTISSKKTKKHSKQRPFDFSSHPRRHVALRIAYLGWEYQGFAVQENTDKTVEARLFEALLKTRLIQDRQTSNYQRCGRTDKGVSAFSQVITIDLRSSLFSPGLGVTLPDKTPSGTYPKTGTPAKNSAPAPGSELEYLKMLNRVLPQDIRVLDWAPAADGFSARFDCQSRTYRYYFPRGALDVELMAEAAQRFVGTHDFRNVCKMDVGNGVLQFQRTILAATIRPSEENASGNPEDPQAPHDPNDPYELFIFEIKGLAFLYHQVRCMMALLLLIGQKLESPEIINQLLDVGSNPRKPQYSMAVDFPLVLYGCDFPGLAWQGGGAELHCASATLQQQWARSAVETHVYRGMLRGLEAMGAESSKSCWLVEGSRMKNYKPLLERPCCESLEARIDHFVKRGRLERDDGENGGEAVHRGKRSKHVHDSAQPSTTKLN
ncbi:tRNA pseudouridine(38/39) synthase [Gadus chalcogrammus]|uniref:tRNA pseudouridine(38/39) synthase n=1 Tax=Gadus chalcogrammus TaxID=1042646 RepID=UPI0024C49F7F|nr:tRNA pseudouridine(38/39) synthase [Gadus chalcogrammus]